MFLGPWKVEMGLIPMSCLRVSTLWSQHFDQMSLIVVHHLGAGDKGTKSWLGSMVKG